MLLDKSPNKDIEYFIDDISYDKNKGHIQGWAVDKKLEKIPDIKLDNIKSEIDSNIMDRIDICEKFNIDKKEKLGFSFDFIKDKKENPVLIFNNGQKNEFKVKIPKKNSLRFELQKIKFFADQAGLFKFLPFYLGYKDINWIDYDNWYHNQNNYDTEEVLQEESKFNFNPLISIVMPVYNIDEKILREALDSVLNQTYKNWELCLADDNSTDPQVRKVLEEYESLDPRINVTFRKENGHIAEATNTALGMAQGDYIAFMDDDDILNPIALHEYVKLLNEKPETELIYCDEDFINNYDFHFNPFFKPDFNKRLFFGHNCLTHFIMVKREIVDQVGGLRTKTNGAQDYDFLLRVLENTDKFDHVEKILYNWRMTDQSVAGNPKAKEYAYRAGQNALQDYFNRNNIPASVELGKNIGTYSITSNEKPKVSILIPFNPNFIGETYETLDSVINNTDYPEVEFLLVNFDKEATQANLPEIDFNNNKFRFIKVKPGTIDENILDAVKLDYPESEYVCVVKTGVKPYNSDWLDKMVNETVFNETGLITPMYINEDEKIISAGYYYDLPSMGVVYPGNAGNVTDLGYFYRTELPQNVEANYGLCYLIQKDDLKKIEKLDKYQEPLAGIDLSNQIMKMGKNVVMTPDSVVTWVGIMTEKPLKPYDWVKGRQPLDSENYDYYQNYQKPLKSYSNDLVKRFRRKMDADYKGLNEYRNV